ncbi:MAG: glycosyltransferase family 39 protein [Chloroflexi bacterium]|nr:glycosyltransferase family 39 protein [Chloroflexota bacterium]
MVSQKKENFWKFVAILGIVLYVVFSVFFILFGRVNADEGWYLYASRLVYMGQRPYQDFAYTQTPLSPYIYGIVQNMFPPGTYLGRITSLFFAIIAALLSVTLVRRYANWMASGITAMLWATFAYGIYYQSIVKTYALLTLLFMLSFYFLSTQNRQEWKLILAALCVVFAALTRLSALLFAIPILLYIFVVASKRSKVIIVVISATAVAWMIWLSFPDVRAVQWNLLIHHVGQWQNLSNIEKVQEIFGWRIPNLIFAYFSYFLLITAIVLLGYKQIFIHLKNNLIIAVVLASTLLFIMPHLVTGGWHIEYFVPAIFVSFTIIGILFTEIYKQQSPYPKIILQVVLLSTFILGLMRDGQLFVDTSGGQMPIQEIAKVSDIVTQLSDPEDEILALEGLWIAIDSDRLTLPGLSMAQFSFLDDDAVTAKRFNLVNGEIVADYIAEGRPKLVVLTDLDWGLLQNSGEAERILVLLNKQYELILRKDEFGQRQGVIEVYVRLDSSN